MQLLLSYFISIILKRYFKGPISVKQFFELCSEQCFIEVHSTFLPPFPLQHNIEHCLKAFSKFSTMNNETIAVVYVLIMVFAGNYLQNKS